MERPKENAPDSEWQAWADARYPYDGRDRATAKGFDVIRSEDNSFMRGRMAWALCKANPEPYIGEHPVPGVPPMPDFGYGNIPLFGDRDGVEE